MVDTKNETKQSSDQKAVNPRDAIREKRERRLRLVTQGKDATVKVYAANETIREAIRHPTGNKAFRDQIDQAVEWPNDSFTARRIADGSVRTDGPGSGEAAEPDETLNAREQAEANKPKKQETSQQEPSKNGGSRAATRPQSQPQPQSQPPAA